MSLKIWKFYMTKRTFSYIDQNFIPENIDKTLRSNLKLPSDGSVLYFRTVTGYLKNTVLAFSMEPIKSWFFFKKTFRPRTDIVMIPPGSESRPKEDFDLLCKELLEFINN